MDDNLGAYFCLKHTGRQDQREILQGKIIPWWQRRGKLPDDSLLHSYKINSAALSWQKVRQLMSHIFLSLKKKKEWDKSSIYKRKNLIKPL